MESTEFIRLNKVLLFLHLSLNCAQMQNRQDIEEDCFQLQVKLHNNRQNNDVGYFCFKKSNKYCSTVSGIKFDNTVFKFSNEYDHVRVAFALVDHCVLYTNDFYVNEIDDYHAPNKKIIFIDTEFFPVEPGYLYEINVYNYCQLHEIDFDYVYRYQLHDADKKFIVIYRYLLL